MKKLLVIVGILLAVIILGYILWPSVEEIEVETTESCLAKEGKISSATCLARVAEDKKDESVCEMISYSGDGFQDACYMGVAIAKKDENLCFLIKNNELENKDQCFSAVAIEKNDNSICKNIEKQKIKDLCFEKVEKFN